MLRIAHPQLKDVLAVPVEDLALAARFDDAELPEFERVPRFLQLPSRPRPAYVLFVFRNPVRVHRFGYGAQQVMAISAKQRRRGADLDGVIMSVADPAGLLAVLREAGVAEPPDLGGALGAIFGFATDEVVVQRWRRRSRFMERARLKCAVGAIVIAAALAVRVALGQGAAATTTVRAGVAAVATALLVGLVLAAAAARFRPRVLRWALPLVLTVGVASALAIPAGLNRLLGPQIGPIHVLVLGASSGIVGGALLAPVLRASPPNPAPSAHAASLAEHQLGWWRASLRPTEIALLAVVALLAASLSEPGSMTELRATTAAVFLDDALPTAWEPCCGGTSVVRGHELDEHICGSDDEALPAHVAAATRSFKKPTPEEPFYADGHLDVTVLLARSARDAVREFSVVHDGAYLPCTIQSVGRLAVYWQTLATGDAQVTFTGREDLDGVDGIIDTFRIRVPIDEHFDVTWATFLRLRIGRAIVRMPLLTFSTEPPDRVEREAIIDGALARIETALADNGEPQTE